jgi:hypothetical protein
MQPENYKTTSPDGKILLTIDAANKKLNYQVSYENNNLILPSSLGFVLKDHDTLANNFRLFQPPFHQKMKCGNNPGAKAAM